MFCPQCGYQIDDDANFCQRCGARVRPIMGSPSAAQAQPGRPPAVGHPGELDREALRIHLSDVLALECIKSRLEDHQKKLAGRIDWRRNSNYLKKCLIREYRYSDGMCSRDYAYLFYNGTSCFLAMEQEYNNMRVCTSDWLPNGCQWVPVDDRSIRSVPRWSKLWSFSTKRECAQGLQKAYAEFRDAAPQAYRDNLQKIQGDTRALEGVAGELKKAGELLEKAYQVNIIPVQFRNLYAVYYLHTFITTSRESLSTALLHYDLNEIKSKLDQIIAQQQEIIIQQAVLAAQNQQMLRQNQMQLERLAAIEDNTRQAAQYAEIAAVNAEACAWLGNASYIDRKLS